MNAYEFDFLGEAQDFAATMERKGFETLSLYVNGRHVVYVS